MYFKDYAEAKGVTRGAIYKTLSRSGHSAKELTDRNGNITPKGYAILRKLYPDDQETLSELLKEPEAEDSTIDELRARLSEAERAREKAEAALENETRQRELYEKLYTETKEELRQQREEQKQQREAAEKERQTLLEKISEANRLISQQQELARLAAMNPIRRLFAGKKKESADTQGTVI